MRINGFEQIKAFYSWVFNNADKRITPQHISLYLFLVNQNNRNNWVEWFKCPFDLGMAGSCIGNKKTYYKCLDDLQEWGMLEYEKGVNNWKAPLIKLEVLNRTASDTATVPSSEPQPTPLDIPLPTPLDTHIYKQVTSNDKPKTSKPPVERDIEKELELKKELFRKNLEPFKSIYEDEMLKEFFDYWTEANAKRTAIRHEKENFFDLAKRLATWKKNYKPKGFATYTQQQTNQQTKPKRYL